MSIGKKCGACGTPQQIANDGCVRCPHCESELFVPYNPPSKIEAKTKISHELDVTPTLAESRGKEVLTGEE
jgi:uncharacterized Zn finger protein (UPF0148 family)